MIDISKIKDIDKEIARIEKEQKTSNSKTDGYRERVKALTAQQAEYSTRLVALKEARQTALVENEDYSALTKEIKSVTAELELVTDEIAGLQKAIRTIESKAVNYVEQIDKLNSEIANLKCVAIARKYNEVALKFSEILTEYHQALAGTVNGAAGGLITTGNPRWGISMHPTLPKLYIKGELDCPEGLLNRPDLQANYYYK